VDISVAVADRTRLTARRTGRGSPVVLVHGSSGGLDSWDPIVPLLADRFELWVYARRGYPPSDGCRSPKTYADDVADLQAVIAAAGGSAHVAGASYGATVALHAAHAGSEAIRSVALFEPPLFAAGATLTPVLSAYRELLRAGDLAAATRLFAEKVARVPAALLAALSSADAAPKSADEQATAAAEAVGCLHDLEAIAADQTDVQRWAGIGVPVLLMQGGETWAPMPSTMDALAGALPKATRVTLPGQSHFATHTAPEPFAAVLREFLLSAGL
jgi:pimeloyl-ACP methyl ester carboxylesterase